jgi:hypothetical protein
MKTIAFVLGALLIVVAVIYLTIPADSLPSFFPGHEAGLARPRMKHGMAPAFCLRMILSDLPTPAEASVHESGPCLGFAQAGNRCPPPIGVEDMLFGIMR